MPWFPNVAAIVVVTVAPLKITSIFLAGIRAWMIKVAIIMLIRTAPIIFCPVLLNDPELIGEKLTCRIERGHITEISVII